MKLQYVDNMMAAAMIFIDAFIASIPGCLNNRVRLSALIRYEKVLFLHVRMFSVIILRIICWFTLEKHYMLSCRWHQ